MAADIVINVRARGDDRVNRMVRGVVSSARRADRDIARSAQTTERSIERSQRRTSRERERASNRTRRVVIEGYRREGREFERVARQELESTRRVQRERRRLSGRGGRGRGSRLDSTSGVGISAASVAARFAPAALGAAAIHQVTNILSEVAQNLANVTNAVQANAGGQDVGQRTVTAQNFGVELTRLTSEIGAVQGLDLEEQNRLAQDLQREILDISQATGQEPGELLQSLRTMQTEFGQFDFGRRNLRALAEEASRSGDEMEDLARFAGQTNQQFGEIPVDQLFNVAAQAGLTSSLTTGAFASNFAGISGVFRSAVDPQGNASSEELSRDFIALANTVRTGTGDAATASTQTRGLLFALSDQQTQQRIALATGGQVQGRGANRRVVGGVQAADFRDTETGRLDLNAYFQALSEEENFQSLEAIGGAVPNVRAAAALNTVLQRQREGGDRSFSSLRNVSAESGAQLRETEIDRVLATDYFRQKAIANQGIAEGIQNVGERSQTTRLAARTQEVLRGSGLFGEYAAGALEGPINLLSETVGTQGTLSDLLVSSRGINPAYRDPTAAERARGVTERQEREGVNPQIAQLLGFRPALVEAIIQQRQADNAVANPDQIRTAVREGASQGIREGLAGQDARSSGGPTTRREGT